MALLSAAANSPNNDANFFVFMFLLLLAAPLSGYIIYALITGAVISPGLANRTAPSRKYSRTGHPFGYWIYMACYAFFSGALLYAAFELYQEGFGTFFR
jgi:hypothetical protein